MADDESFIFIMKRAVVYIHFVLFIMCLLPFSAKPALTRFEYSEVAMGVRARIVVYAVERESADRACKAAFERIALLEEVMSDYRPDSELMRLCTNAGGQPFSVSGELLHVLQKSQELSRRSDGAFDATIGPLVKLWREARKTGVLPPQEEIRAAQRLVGWWNITINVTTGTVLLKQPDMRLDLGGIAKGFACDEAIRILKEHGIKSALVEMGGDIAVSAPPPGQKGWEIMIPNAPDPVHKQAILSNAAVSSSGDTEQYVELNGQRYSHIVNPKTGLGLTDRIAVTVIAPNATLSDGLSTTLSVLGERRGRTLAGTYPGVRVFIRQAR